MRYLISAHGCYRKNEKVPLHQVRLEFHSAENEYVEYSDAYLKTFCTKSINKRNNAYKPVRKVDHHYYEMEFGRESKDTFTSFIYCCTTREILYDFNYGDLLLSDVVDMIRIHAHLRNHDKWIYLSMLTCNDECRTKKEEVGVVLHRKKSFTEMNIRPKTYNWKKIRTLSLNTRKQNMLNLPYSQRSRKHILKIGNTVKHRSTGVTTIIESKEQKKSVKQDPEQVYLPNLKLDDSVMYESDLWTIVDVQGVVIQHPMTGMQKTVEATDLVKLEFN
jgi:hypothetical protein